MDLSLTRRSVGPDIEVVFFPCCLLIVLLCPDDLKHEQACRQTTALERKGRNPIVIDCCNPPRGAQCVQVDSGCREPLGLLVSLTRGSVGPDMNWSSPLPDDLARSVRVQILVHQVDNK